MLVSIFNTTDRSGGAGIAAFRLARALDEHGVQAPIFCLHRRFNDPGTFRYRVRNSEMSRSLQVHREALQLVQKRYVAGNRTSRSKTIFSEPWAAGLLVGDNPMVAASRILHLHWVNHFLDLHSLQELAALGRPIVWTLHDEWLYTAGCHYTSGCDAFRSRCVECPQLLIDPFQLVEQWFDQKAEVLAGLDLTIVTPSEWLGDRARRSTLLRGKRVEVIRNAFDVEVFKPKAPAARRDARSRHGFDDQTIVFGFGAASLRDVRKGYGLLLAAMSKLADEGAFKGRPVGVLVFGSRSEELDALTGHIKVAYVGELHEESAIAEVLGAVDAFVVPSLEENYPNVIIEALLCGTPVIAYGCGGIPEQVHDGLNGLLVQPVGDVPALAGALHRFHSDAGLRHQLSQFDRTAIADRHTFQAIGAQTLRLYRQLCSDFDEPVDPAVVDYRTQHAALKGPAREFLAVPSYRSVPDTTPACVVSADLFDEVQDKRRAVDSATRDRQYLGFFDAPLRFGAAGTGARFLNFGWSPSESQGVWSAEPSAGVAFFAPPGAKRLALRLIGHCKGQHQVMVVRIGSQELGRLKLTSARATHELSLTLPDHAAAGGLVQLQFDFPHAQREPNSPRLLGLYLCELSAELTLASDSTGSVAAR